MASSTLVFTPLSLPKPVSFSTSKPSLSFFSLSSSSLVLRSKPFTSLRSSSRFVRNVAVTSEFEQEEDVSGDVEEANFSPDLKIFVGNLPFNVESADLAELFEQAGNVEMVEVIYDKITGRSRGFGFVTMSTIAEVASAVQQFNGFEFAGRPLRVNAGPPPRRDESGFSRGPRTTQNFESANRLYVGNLSWGVDNSALEELFSEQGKVVEARVVFDRESGRSRGFGFVTYNSAEEANNAVESLNGVDLDGRSIRVSVAEAKPRRF